jgi:2-polyprenyl-3-methyl-5-hydroxy-6-metoxy-1,4-benzoquinol methylase
VIAKQENLNTPRSVCPCCGSSAKQLFLCPATFNYGSHHELLECGACSVSYFNPVPSLTNLTTFYSTHDYEFNPHSQAARARTISRGYLRHKPLGRFLDMGCATGFLLDAVQRETGWEVHGVELVEKAARFANTVLHLKNVLNLDLERARYPDAYFDVVHISEVLEHVPDPAALLRECRRILKPDGLFFLSLPNGTADRQGMIDYWRLYRRAPGHASGHIFFFSERSLSTLLSASGFKVVASSTYAFKQGLRSIGLFPKRRNWEGMFAPRTEAEVPNETEIQLPERKHSDFYYCVKYGLREKFKVCGLQRFGLGWHLVCKSDRRLNGFSK